MRKLLFILCTIVSTFASGQNLITPFEISGGKKTATYQEIIGWWKKADLASDKIKMFTKGPSDAGFPLNLIVVSDDKDFDFTSLHKKNKCVLLINNGIHPGEPDGIDASMLLVKDIISNKFPLPKNVVLAIIPLYNIGGCFNRNSNYRIDQNGPDAFGFRGNSQNLDLNRDFIKNDSKEAGSFAAIFHEVDPDIFIDNHVSNGADYQHIITLLSSQHNKLGGVLGDFMEQKLEPAIYALMKQRGYDLVPYVNAFGETPETGWPQFMDQPRFSSGYAAMWGTLGFMPETHMLKPYEQRVKATFNLMESFIQFAHENVDGIQEVRAATKASVKNQSEFAINWSLDRSKSKEINFEGFTALHKTSNVSGQQRLYYDRSQPFEKKVKFYNVYEPSLSIKKPAAYIIPQGWWKVINILRANKVEMTQLKSDQDISVDVYRIEDYKSAPHAYEGHHLNNRVQLSTTTTVMHFRKGDYVIPMNQVANRYLMEVLEPQGDDSFFAWNFFDAILGQKEGFSEYVFEEKAEKYLQDHPDVKAKLEAQRNSDSAFAKNGEAQLDFVYKHSPYYEPDHLRYPVYRIKDEEQLKSIKQ